MTIEYKYPFWIERDEEREYIFDSNTESVYDALSNEGFDDYVSYIEPYFLNNFNVFIKLYSCSNKIGKSIVALGNFNRELFSFYCRNNRETLECVKYLLEMAKNIVEIEYRRKFLNVQSALENPTYK